MHRSGGLELERRLASYEVASRLFGTSERRPSLGGYELLRRVGAGGMGVVFEAHDLRTGQRVALKVLHERGPDALQRLKREFRVLAHLHHENLVELYELSSDREQPFLIMELVEGCSLFDHVRPDGALRPTLLRASLRQLVDAVSALHAAGVVHRDLKPSNLLVRPDGRLVVLDFGLAHALEGEDAGLSRSGTPIYMAPERLHGTPGGEASDWYSVGVIACEALGLPLPVRSAGPSALPEGELRAGGELAELGRLCLRLCAKDPEARPGAAELRAYFGLPAVPSVPGLLSVSPADPVFVGREPELEQLRRAFARATAGGPVIVHLSGEPGIGKTALAAHFGAALRAEGAALVLGSGCYEREHLPYNAFDELIDGLARELAALGPEERRALCPDGAAELCRSFPALAPCFPAVTERSAGADPLRLRRAAFAALRELLSRLAAARPLVLHFDDLQWGDADSAQLLAALFDPQSPVRWLVIASYRGAAERSACVQALHRVQFGRAGETLALELGPLGPEASLSLARALAGARASEQALAQASREACGSPLFLRAILQHQQRRAGAGEFSATSLSELLASVLSELPAPSRRLLELAALAAEPLERALLLAAARLDTPDVSWAEHLVALERMRLLRRVPLGERPGLEPYHARVREAAVAALPPGDKSRCHLNLAAAAEQLWPEEHEFLAAHYEGAGERARAALHAERAADRALEAVALEHAAALYAQALRNARGRPGQELLRKLADATAYTGRCAEAVPLYLRAAEAASPKDAVELRVQASEMLLRCGLVQEGRRVLGPILRSVGLRLPRSTQGALLSAFARLAWIRFGPAAPARREPSERERLRNDVCFSLGLRWGLIDPPRTCALLVRGYLLARKASTDAQLARALTGQALALAMLWPGSGREQDRLLEQARALALRAVDRDAMGAVLYVRALSRFIRAEFHAALEWIEEARREIAAQCRDAGWFLQELDTAACCQLAFTGGMAELDRILGQSVAAIRESGNLFQCELMDGHRGFALLARDEPEAAIAHSQRIIDTWRDHEAYQVAATGVWAQLHAFLYVRDHAAAYRLMREHWPILSERGYTRAQPWRCMITLWEGTVALACAQASFERKHVAHAEETIERLRGMRVFMSEPSQRLLEAGLAHLQGERARAAALYAAAVAAFDDRRMFGYASAARLRQAELSDPERAASLRAEAQAYSDRERIVRPGAFARMYAPIGTSDPKTQ